MRNFTFLKMMLVAIALVIGSVSVWGQVNIVAGNSINQDFNIGGIATTNLPTGWKADKLSTARTLGTYTAAVSATAIIGGNDMSPTASNGIYNFGAGIAASATDRSIGGLSSSSASKSVNVYVQLTNNGVSEITNFIIGYNVEKYRKGSNSAGFSIQMYYSTDGSIWTSAGSDFLTSFVVDADNTGYITVPGTTISIVNKTLNQTIAAGSSIYLAWNYSVTSGTTTSNSQALGIDDVSINAIGGTSCTPSTLAFSNTTLNKTMADAVFTQTATSLNGTTTITYTSNNTAVANVNETSGEVTLVGAGVAIITATQAAGTHSAVNYCASTTTYSLNVASILPTITVTEVTVPAMVALVGNTVTETVNVKGENLTNNIGLALSGENATQFNLSTNSLPQSGGNVSNTAIIITYIPTQQGSHTATLTITSNGATSVLRTLTGTAYQLVGDGTTLNPYTVADVKTLNNSLGAVTKYWVLGYIIGVPSGGDGINLTTVDLDAPFASNSVIAISNTKNDADLSKMIAVQLPAGNVRNALNLVDNATVLNKWVKVYGTLEGYFSGTPGVKNTTEYLLESIGTGFNQLGDKLNIYVSENIIKFESSANETVSIYNTVGQKLVQKLALNGLNTIPVSARGVVLVKVGNRFAKVIL